MHLEKCNLVYQHKFLLRPESCHLQIVLHIARLCSDITDQDMQIANMSLSSLADNQNYVLLCVDSQATCQHSACATQAYKAQDSYCLSAACQLSCNPLSDPHSQGDKDWEQSPHSHVQTP